MDTGGLGRLLIFAGAGAFLLGIVLILWGRFPLLGHLPGDILFRRGGTTVYLPIVTMLLLSLLLTVVLNIAARLLR